MTEPILSHIYENGLVLVAEPMTSLESAAFSFLVPAGCVQEPPDRAGLAAFTCEMALRGAGKPRQPAVHRRSGKPGRRAGRIGFGQSHQFRRRDAVEESLAGAGNLCRPAAPAASAGRPARSRPGRGGAGSCVRSRTSRPKR